jgi:hypothetical protein
LNKVYPYKKIIPKELREDLIKYYLNHDYKPMRRRITRKISTKCIDSRIIAMQHAEVISKWIDRLEITNEIKNQYEFKLIIRGSRDGFPPDKFHEICDNQSHTVTIFKVKDTDEILGGYNPIIWNSKYGFSANKEFYILF